MKEGEKDGQAVEQRSGAARFPEKVCRTREETSATTMRGSRRKFERVPTSIPVQWGLEPGEFSRRGRILSLSAGGCLIQTELEPLFGKTIHLQFLLPAEQWAAHWVTLRGEPVYTLRNVGFAVEFAELTEAERETLKLLVLYYREMGDRLS